MYTSNYNIFMGKDYREVSISGDRGKKANYNGAYYQVLAPKKEFWQEWYNNIGIVSEDQNNKFYVREYYKQVLSKLDPEQVYFDLKDKILLCYENSYEFCHRVIVAYWFELLFDVEVSEIEIKNESFFSVERKDQQWIKSYLEEVIRNNTSNMKGFTSLMALRLLEKGEKYDQKGYLLNESAKNMYKTSELLRDIDKSESDKLYTKAKLFEMRSECYHFEADGLRCKANDAEQEYLEKNNYKSKTKLLNK